MTRVLGLICPNCETEFPLAAMVRGCPACITEQQVANLEVSYDFETIAVELTPEIVRSRQPSLWRYFELLPVSNRDHIVSLGEGMTPLLPLPRLGPQLGADRLWLKNESVNPTWSFKDRLCSVAISMAVELGAPGIVASSSGNHGASAAAYAARAGLPCIVLTLESSPQEVKDQMQVYGAQVIATSKSEHRWILMSELIARGWFGVTNFTDPAVGSIPFGVEGQKTMAYEIWEQLDGQVPDFVIAPTAYADGLSGIWKGFRELHRLGWIQKLPRMVAAEAHGPLANAMKKGLDYVEAVAIERETVAHSIGGPISTTQGLRTLRESSGAAIPIDDDQIMEAQILLSQQEGIFLEPTSATAVAALRQLTAKSEIKPHHSVVIIGTSSGLKDPTPSRRFLPTVPVIEPELIALKNALREGNHYELPA